MKLPTFVLSFLLFLLLVLVNPYSSQAEVVSTAPEEHIGVASIRSNVLPGIMIGGHYEGLLKILQQPYTASGSVGEQMETVMRRIIEDELSQSGYLPWGMNQQSVFADQLPEEMEPPRFLMGGTITQVEFNTYDSWLGRTTEERRAIRWEVLDRQTNRIVARQETWGSAKVPGLDNPAAIYESTRKSFQAFLAQANLDALVHPVSITQHPASPSRYEVTAIVHPDASLPVREILRHAVPETVTIRSNAGRGSGFFIDESGLLLTNQHVVGSAFSVNVDLYDGSTHPAHILKRNVKSDLALLQMEDPISGIQGLPLCHTGAIHVGEEVVAIGNPLRLTNTVTRGIVSAIRTTGRRHLIQTDVAINPGNSGGPLLNYGGAVIGIITEKVASPGVEGLGFALPIAESLQQLGIQVRTPNDVELNSCGNPDASA
ncbi:MAG: trypsin-like peptidase domain-containing protein [Leptolyngbyaceae cyanobacterium bins.59]|nr:trypsin-like peptidase domain-containing protein [Leptolyngbyaceae cyanobacterium bins.59]